MTLLFLGLIALLTAVSAACLLVIVRETSRAARTLDDVTGDLGRSLGPIHEDLSRAARNFAHVSDMTAHEARRLNDLMSDLAARVGSIRDFLEHVLLPLGGYVATFGAGVRMVRRAARLLRRPRRPRSRPSRGDGRTP